MVKNNFRVAFIFKTIIKICKKNVEFCGKTSKFLPKRRLLIFCIFYLNEQQICLIRYIQDKISNSASHKKKEKKEGEEQQHNLTSNTSFLKHLKNCP